MSARQPPAEQGCDRGGVTGRILSGHAQRGGLQEPLDALDLSAPQKSEDPYTQRGSDAGSYCDQSCGRGRGTGIHRGEPRHAAAPLIDVILKAGCWSRPGNGSGGIRRSGSVPPPRHSIRLPNPPPASGFAPSSVRCSTRPGLSANRTCNARCRGRSPEEIEGMVWPMRSMPSGSAIDGLQPLRAAAQDAAKLPAGTPDRCLGAHETTTATCCWPSNGPSGRVAPCRMPDPVY